MNYGKNGNGKNNVSYKAIKANKKLDAFLPQKEKD